MGYETRQILKKLPIGEGDAKKWLNDRFESVQDSFKPVDARDGQETKYHALVFITDADDKDVKTRIRTLTKNNHLKEHVAIVVPKHCIESWFLFWMKHKVVKYDKSDKDTYNNMINSNTNAGLTQSIIEIIQNLAQQTTYLNDPTKPDSLNLACQAITRLKLLEKAYIDQSS